MTFPEDSLSRNSQTSVSKDADPHWAAMSVIYRRLHRPLRFSLYAVSEGDVSSVLLGGLSGMFEDSWPVQLSWYGGAEAVW